MKSTAMDLITEAAMSGSYTAHLFVEGPTDKTMLSQALGARSQVNILPAGNCERVLDAIAAYEAALASIEIRPLPPVFGVIDRDFRVALGTVPTSSRVVITDLRDIDCEIVDTPAFEHIATTLCSEEKLRKTNCTVSNLKTLVINAAKTIGALRFLNEKLNWGINFQYLEPEAFITRPQFVIDRRKFILHLNGPQVTKRISAQDLDAADSETKTNTHLQADLHICSGHDILNILHVGLRKMWGNNSCTKLTLDLLHATFRTTAIPYLHTRQFFVRLRDALRAVGAAV